MVKQPQHCPKASQPTLTDFQVLRWRPHPCQLTLDYTHYKASATGHWTQRLVSLSSTPVLSTRSTTMADIYLAVQQKFLTLTASWASFALTHFYFLLKMRVLWHRLLIIPPPQHSPSALLGSAAIGLAPGLGPYQFGVHRRMCILCAPIFPTPSQTGSWFPWMLIEHSRPWCVLRTPWGRILLAARVLKIAALKTTFSTKHPCAHTNTHELPPPGTFLDCYAILKK